MAMLGPRAESDFRTKFFTTFGDRFWRKSDNEHQGSNTTDDSGRHSSRCEDVCLLVASVMEVWRASRDETTFVEPNRTIQDTPFCACAGRLPFLYFFIFYIKIQDLVITVNACCWSISRWSNSRNVIDGVQDSNLRLFAVISYHHCLFISYPMSHLLFRKCKL